MTITQPLLETVEQSPPRPADAAVIWLHGLGADGHDFAALPPQLGVPPDAAVRYVFPHAPERPVTVNLGLRMRAWYDIASLGERSRDEAGIRRSAAAVDGLIAREIERGVPSTRIVLAGFSQGAATALFTGLRHPRPLGGIVALSGYLPLADALADEASPANRQIEIFLAHGGRDEVVPCAWGRESAARLRAAGCRVEWREYAMAHEVCREEVLDIGRWLAGRLHREGES